MPSISPIKSARTTLLLSGLTRKSALEHVWFEDLTSLIHKYCPKLCFFNPKYDRMENTIFYNNLRFESKEEYSQVLLSIELPMLESFELKVDFKVIKVNNDKQFE